MNEHLIKRAEAFDFDVIDLEPIFTEHYERHSEKFEFSTDGHWNELGHLVAAKAYVQHRSRRDMTQ